MLLLLLLEEEQSPNKYHLVASMNDCWVPQEINMFVEIDVLDILINVLSVYTLQNNWENNVEVIPKVVSVVMDPS